MGKTVDGIRQIVIPSEQNKVETSVFRQLLVRNPDAY